MSPHRPPLLTPGVELVFLPGRPARSGRFALWHPVRVPDSFTDTVELVLPSGSSLRGREVPALVVPLRDLVDELVALPAEAEVAPSTHGWAQVVREALAQIASGRLLPIVDDAGTDGWRIGPFDDELLARRDAVADALPPSAHCTAVVGSAPRRISSARWLVARCWDAVADAYVRTAAAAVVAGHEAYAGQAPVAVQELFGSATVIEGPWPEAGGGAGSSTIVALRLEADDEVIDPADLDLLEESGFVAVVEVTSAADPSLVLDARDLWTASPAVAARFGPTAADEVLLALRRGARVWPPLGRLLREARPDRLVLDGDEVEDLLGDVSTELAERGIAVRWPSGVLASLDLAPMVVDTSIGSDRDSTLGLASLYELQWEPSIDGETLTEAELAELVQAKRAVVRLRGRWVRADPRRLARAQERRKLTTGEALAAALGGPLAVDDDQVAVAVAGPLAQLGERLRDATGRDGFEPSARLQAELRPYQHDGAAWLVEMAELGLGGVLADDMGLGKTVQFLAAHLARTEQPDAPPSLVICPVSVLGNWAREAARFAPSVPVLRYHGTTRSLDHIPPGALVLTTYGVARREAALLGQTRWGLVAADEAQAIKNPRSRTAKALRTLPAAARFALTGTPVENRLLDLWALLDWTTPGLLGPLEHFRRDVAGPIERDHDEEVAEKLSTLLRPFLLRRRKSDPAIAPDLPPKTETDRIVPLTVEQATLYRATVEQIMAEVAEAEGMSRRGLVLKLLTGLKQICNHPAQYLKQDGPLSGRSGKFDAVEELIETIMSEGESVLVFTQYVAMGELLTKHLAAPGRPTQFLHGGVPATARQEMVDRFQAGEVPVFVISVKAGGTGLNLTRATHVIHYDRWWNPAVEDQASDRAWRIGQDRPVQVHRMICEGTVEDRVSVLLAEKRALADAVITSGEGWVSELGDDDLRALVALGAVEGDE